MADETSKGDEYSQEDIDDMFNNLSQGQGGKPADPAPEGDDQPADEDVDAAASESASINQDELDSLLSGVGSLDPGELGDGESAENIEGLEDFQFPEAGAPPANLKSASIELLRDVSLQVKIELGRANMYVKDVLSLDKGSVVELDRLAGDPLDILVNDRLVAKGEVLVLNDNFCIRVTEILSPRERSDQERA